MSISRRNNYVVSIMLCEGTVNSKKYVLFFLWIFLFLANPFLICSLQDASLSPTKIVEKYGKAVVLIASVNQGGETITQGSGFLVDPMEKIHR